MTPPPLDATDLQWLTRLAAALVRDPHAADDLAQETLVAALEAPPPPETPRRAWLASVARRLAARRFRGDTRRARRERRASRDEALPDAAELVERAEVAELLAAATRRLEEPYRRTLLLRFLEGRTPAEIAEDQGLAVDTVRWRVRRGLALLREELTRSHPRDWSAWCALLLPLARSGGDAGLATAGATGALTISVAVWTTMKLTMIGGAALAAGLWLVWATVGGAGEPPPSSDIARVEEPAPAAPPVETPLPGRAGTERVEELAAREAPQATPTPDPNAVSPAGAARALAGRVVDEAGDPIVGATVYVVPAADEDSGDGAPDRRSETDETGRFRLVLPPGEGAPVVQDAVELGASANGYLRQVVSAGPPTPGASAEDDELVLVLGRGQVLQGRVLDADGLPVPGLELLAHTTGAASIAHVSPSRMLLRSDRAELGGADSPYQQCRARTDGQGFVGFEGLGAGQVDVLSLDPGWTIEEPDEALAGGPFVEWLARPRLGVSVAVTDEATGAPVEQVSAVFHVVLTYADGESDDLSQWVGSGAGNVSFVLGPGTFIDLDDRTVVRAEFYGTVEAYGIEVPWRSEVLEDPYGVRGVARATATIPATSALAADVETEADGSADPTLSAGAARPVTSLDLEVRLPDGTPFEGELVVRWLSRPKDGPMRKGDADVSPEAPGVYRLDVDAGAVDLEISDGQASGSLPPWRGSIRGDAGWTTPLEVVLPRGGAVTIARPVDWTGEWQVHASWRPPGEAEWRGSWYYGTLEDTLRLTSLRPAEWRFRLNQSAEMEIGPDDLVRTVSLSAWDDLIVR